MSNLFDLNASAFEYHNAIFSKFTEICEPLFQLGVKYFSYHKLFQDGRYIFLKNQPEYIKAYFETIYNNGKYFTKQIHHTYFTSQVNNAFLTNNHCVLLPQELNVFVKTQDPIMHLLYEHDIWNALIIYEMNESNSVEAFSFAMSKADTYAFEFYSKHLDLLKHFILYFKERAKDLIDCSDKRRLAYFKQEFDFSQRCFHEIASQQIEKFLQDTRLKSLKIHGKNEDVFLSAREIECLKYLSLGKNIKEIGRTLELSPKTIDFYLQNIKRKTGFSSRAQIINEFNKIYSRTF